MCLLPGTRSILCRIGNHLSAKAEICEEEGGLFFTSPMRLGRFEVASGSWSWYSCGDLCLAGCSWRVRAMRPVS